MDIRTTIWHPDTKVTINSTDSEDLVVVHLGDYPGSGHTSWFMWEKDLDIFVKNMLDAQLKYIQEKKHETTVS